MTVYKFIFTCLFLSIIFTFPVFIQDAEAEYNRFHKMYSNLKYEDFAVVWQEATKRKKDIDELLAYAKQESNFDKNAFNPISYDFGFFQINHKHNPAKPEIYFDLRTNTIKAIEIMEECEKKSNYNFAYTCMRYNAGPNKKDHEYTNFKYAELVAFNYKKNIESRNTFYSDIF